MITGPVFATFTDAYLGVFDEIYHRNQYRTSSRAKTAIETTNVSFTIADPIARTTYVAARRTNIVFNHAEALWYLAGRDDLDMIAYYAPRLRRFSADQARLTGSAYGPRLFHATDPDGQSQFDRVLNLLRTDPDTKRATMLIMRPDELVDRANPDVACTLGLQFMLRGGWLHLTAYMRGNDAMIGLLGDTFAFTFIQEYAARLLGVEVGSYALHVGSMHLNTLDLPKADAILTERDGPSFPSAEMPASTSRADLRTVLDWEERLRLNRARFTPGVADLEPYWQQIIALFEVYRQIAHEPGQPISADALAVLQTGHRWLVERRWPHHMPVEATT